MRRLPKTQELTERILQSIRNGIYPDATELPSEDSLASEYKMSRSTVRVALSNLSKQGAIIKTRGKHSVVCASVLKGVHRPLRFAWIGYGPLDQSLVYLSIYSELQKLIVAGNGTLSFLPLENPESEAWVSGIAGTFDGIFLAGVRKGMLLPQLEKILTSMKNTIEIDDIANPVGYYNVCTDNYAAGRMAAAYLLDHHCNTLAFVDTSCALYRGFHNRMCGFVDEYHFRKKTPVMNSWNSNLFEAQNQLKQIIHEHPETDTIWYETDNGALNIRRMLERDFPRRIFHSAGVDGIHKVIDGVKNHLSLAQPVREIAQTSFQIMFDLISGKAPAENVFRIKPVLIPWNQQKSIDKEKQNIS